MKGVKEITPNYLDIDITSTHDYHRSMYILIISWSRALENPLIGASCFMCLLVLLSVHNDTINILETE